MQKIKIKLKGNHMKTQQKDFKDYPGSEVSVCKDLIILGALQNPLHGPDV